MTINDGLYLEPDTSPYTNTTLNIGNTLLYDGIINTEASVNYWYGSYSYGIDLGVSTTINKLICYTVEAGGGDVNTWYDSGYDSVSVYMSNDNSTWTFIQQFDAPEITYHTTGIVGFSLPLSASPTARYFKVVNIEALGNTIAFGSGGNNAKISEIEYTIPSGSSSSSSTSSSSSSSSSSTSSFFDSKKVHFWSYVLNEEGQPIKDAQIRLYLNDDPTTEANIFISESSSYTTCSVADIKTDNDGYFEFWLSGSWENGGYDFTQKFRLEWYKAGIAPGLIENVDPWPNAFMWQDINSGADKNYKNKFVSDYYANKWWTHANEIVPLGSPHDLYPVDYESGCDNNRYNKVVSNKFLYDILQNCYDSDSQNITNDGVYEYTENVTSWSTSGDIYYKDITHNFSGDVYVTLVDLDSYYEIWPKRIILLSLGVSRIEVTENLNVKIIVQGTTGLA